MTGIDWSTLESTARLEAFSTHLMVPMLVTLALAYASQLLGRLEAERERSERLALQSERRRIAWELHDPAKQRLHVASHTGRAARVRLPLLRSGGLVLRLEMPLRRRIGEPRRQAATVFAIFESRARRYSR